MQYQFYHAVVAKTLEKLVCSQPSNYLNEENIYQSGYM